MRGEEGNKKKELKKAIGGAREEGSDTMKIFGSNALWMLRSFMSSRLNIPYSLALAISQSTQFEEVIPRYTLTTVLNEGDVLKPQGGETFDEESIFVDPGLDMNGCLDRVMKDCEGEEDATHSPRSEKCSGLGLGPP
ncbi:unnamed protein product [Brassica oleracea]